MAIDLSQLLSLLTSAGGGALSANAAGNSSSDLSKLLASLQGNQLQPGSLSGPGGQYSSLFGNQGGATGPALDAPGFRINPGGSISQMLQPAGAAGQPGGNGSSIGLGNLDSAYNGLAGFGTSKVGQATGMGNGLPLDVATANQGVTGLMNGQQFQPGLASTAFAGAQSQAQAASQGFPQVFQSTLQALRANAAPDNLLAANQLQDSLFGSGRLGTTGGGLLATSFAKGLGQADSTYQLQAQQAAMAQQQNALGLSQGLTGIGSGVTSLGENLTQGLFNRGQQVLGNQVNLSQLPGALQGQQLGLGLQGLAGASALNQQGLNNFQATLAQAVAQANAKNATANAQANIAGTKAGTPTSGDIWGQVLTGLGSRLNDPNSGLNSILNGLFGGSGSTPGGVNDINNALYGEGGDFSSWLSGIMGGTGFSGAGGQAAAAGPTGTISLTNEDGSPLNGGNEASSSFSAPAVAAPLAAIGGALGASAAAAPVGTLTLTDLAGNALAGGASAASGGASAASTVGSAGAGSAGGGAAGAAAAPIGAVAAGAAIVAAAAAGIYGGDQKGNSINKSMKNQQSRDSLLAYLTTRDSMAAMPTDQSSANLPAWLQPETAAGYGSYFSLPAGLTAAQFSKLSLEDQQKYAADWAGATGGQFMVGNVDGTQYTQSGGTKLTQRQQDISKYGVLSGGYQTPTYGSDEYNAIMASVMGPNYGG